MYVLEKSIIPMPKHMENKNGRVKLASMLESGFQILKDSNEPLVNEGAKWIECDVWKKVCVRPTDSGYKIIIKVDPSDERLSDVTSDEGYYIDVTDESATLCGKSEKGAFYAAVTLKRMLYTEGGELYIHKAYIKDYPDFEMRGHSVECRYGTDLMEKEEWLDFIDYCADIKCNQIHVKAYNCWGVQYDDEPVEYLQLPLKCYPELKTLKNKKYYSVKNGSWRFEKDLIPPMARDDFYGELVTYGKKRNITVCPGLASYGHNTLLPRMMPEIAPVMADGSRGKSGRSVLWP